MLDHFCVLFLHIFKGDCFERVPVGEAKSRIFTRNMFRLIEIDQFHFFQKMRFQ